MRNPKHNPARNQCLYELMRILRKRHKENPRRMYARRWEVWEGKDTPIEPNPRWYLMVAARWWRWKEAS